MPIRKISIIISFLIIIKSLLWLFSIPIFQSPDEAFHFAYVQYLGEQGRSPHPRRETIISQELVLVAENLNFNWGQEHPVWKGYPERWQEKIKEIPKENRVKYVSGEQRVNKNPPLYYWLGALFYRLFWQSNFFYRFYSVRFFSLLLSLFALFFIYKIGKIFFKDKRKALVLVSLVAFQPMFSFIGVSINTDILAIFIATLFIYSGLKKDITLSFLTIFLGLLVKPILIVLLFIFPSIFKKKIMKGIGLSLGLLAVIYLSSLAVLENVVKPTTPIYDFLRYQIAFADYQVQVNFFCKSIINGKIFSQFIQYFTVNKVTYLHNLFPWYWGVFGWLEATMPLPVYTLLKLICVASLLGLFMWFSKNYKKNNEKKWQVIFLILSVIIFYLGVIFNDFKVFTVTGEAFGIQGRYLLPVISAQMILLILGLKMLVPKKFHNFLSLFLIVGSIALNIIGFWTMSKYFYG